MDKNMKKSKTSKSKKVKPTSYKKGRKQLKGMLDIGNKSSFDFVAHRQFFVIIQIKFVEQSLDFLWR